MDFSASISVDKYIHELLVGRDVKKVDLDYRFLST